jgi:hypothetical protein
MTDEDLQAKTKLFNTKLAQYGRQKALHSRLGSKWHASETLEELNNLLKEIQEEIERRKNEAQKSASA